jgi:hypothetical protein
MNDFINTINKQYSDHYKYIGELRQKYDKRNDRRCLMLYIGAVALIILTGVARMI